MKRPQVKCIDTKQGMAYVIDGSIDEEALRWIDNFRCSLPLNSKRPTVDRRFFADGPEALGEDIASQSFPIDSKRPIARTLEVAMERSIFAGPNDGSSNQPNSSRLRCHVFRYQRFLEYTKVGSQLDPHTDGNKVCDDTQLTSTHTLLLYLTDCSEGGETLVMTRCAREILTTGSTNDGTLNGEIDDPVLHATHPRRGRILIFPHSTPHAGAKVVSVPKICLRAEVALLREGGDAVQQARQMGKETTE
jgi:hypothetical protein